MGEKKRKQVALEEKSPFSLFPRTNVIIPRPRAVVYRIPNTQVFPNNEEACFISTPYYYYVGAPK